MERICLDDIGAKYPNQWVVAVDFSREMPHGKVYGSISMITDCMEEALDKEIELGRDAMVLLDGRAVQTQIGGLWRV